MGIAAQITEQSVGVDHMRNCWLVCQVRFLRHYTNTWANDKLNQRPRRVLTGGCGAATKVRWRAAVTATCIVHKHRFPAAGIILSRVIRVFLSDVLCTKHP